MKSLLRLIFVCLSVSCCLFDPLESKGVSDPEQEIQEENKVHFLWAFGALVDRGNGQKLLPITRDTTLQTGDQLKIFVELKRKCFVYLLYYNSKGNFHMLFPFDTEGFTSDQRISEEYLIPPGKFTFKLDDNLGIETFHLLASGNRLNELEALVVEHESDVSANKPELAKRILSQIRKTKRENKKLTAVAERPASIGGRVRGTENGSNPLDITTIAVEISAGDFYSRTFTIEHQ
ncbi:MAG: DUF4384 domain-containing protein [Thermodesulfobacteriota bacterium]|nr:DUF4384 domain-containing protein [Thermodesulfobacteriota bacterium]